VKRSRLPGLRTLAPFAAVLLVIIGYGLFWYMAAGRAEAGFAKWRQKAVAAGYEIDGKASLGGFPFRLEYRISGPRIATTGADGQWAWQADGLLIVAHPWNLRHLVVLIDEGQSLTLAAPGSPLTSQWRLRSGHARASVIIGNKGPKRITIELPKPVLTPVVAGGAPANPLLMAERLLLHWRNADFPPSPKARPEPPGKGPPEQPDVAAFAARAEGVSLAAGEGRVDLLEAEATLKGAWPRGVAGSDLAGWTTDGGSLQITHFQLDWGPLHLNASGPLAVDSAGRPTMAMDMSVNDTGALLSAFRESRLIDQTVAGAAGMMLGLLRKGDRDDTISLPAIISDGRFYLGPVPLMAVAPLPGSHR